MKNLRNTVENELWYAGCTCQEILKFLSVFVVRTDPQPRTAAYNGDPDETHLVIGNYFQSNHWINAEDNGEKKS